jgi:uncharacterized membrane protein YfcA
VSTGERVRRNPPTVETLAASDILPAVTRLHMALIGALFGAAFAISSILRDAVAPGLVGGVLCAVLVYLVLQRVHEHNEALRRRRREHHER